MYLNALEDVGEEGLGRVKEAYGPNYDRLVSLEGKDDPMNLFRLNANIVPNRVDA